MSFEQFLQYCLSGITVGSIYAIVAIGFNIIYNTTGIINFAQGEFLILGGMVAITLSSLMPLLPAMLIAVGVTVIIGALVEIVFIRWLKSPNVLRLIVITIGISILLREVMRNIAGHFQVTLDEYDEDTLATSIMYWKPFPDTVESLRYLKEHYKLAVISNIDDDLFAHSARHLSVPFDWVITAEQVESYKPSLNNFERAIERIGLPPEKILHVAQSLYHDIVPANELGLTNVWVNRRHNRKGHGATFPAHAEPTLEVPDLATLAVKVAEAFGD